MDEQSFITFGVGGHEGEYCLHIAGYDFENYIPQGLVNQLKQLLPDWAVDNRGTRVEIMNKQDYGRRDDDVVLPAVRAVFGEVELV